MHFIGNKSLPHTSIATHYGVNGNSLIRQGSFSHRSLLVLHKKNRPTSSVARHLSSNDNDDTNNNAASLDSYAASLDSSINGSTDINIDIDAENTKINSTTKEDIKNAKSAIQTALFNRAPFATEEDKRSKKEIDGLIQKQKERDTKINRLKFQLTEFKESLQESEVQKKEMQDDLNILKETKKIVDNEDGTDDIVKIM
jgi:chromosome segregation ATPase